MSVCEAPDCARELEGDNPRARFCGSTCRRRAARARKAAEAAAELEVAAAAEPDGPQEHKLVTAVRKELADAGVLDSVDGQIALQIARRVVDAGASGVSALSKELRAVLADAKAAGVTRSGGGHDDDDPDPEPEDEVTRARRLREEARKEAGLT